jgi:hypothetical protein
MSMQDDLKTVFDSVVKKDDDAASAAFSAYIDQKSVEVLKGLTEAKFKSPIQIKGNDVFVNGKKVGGVKHNAEENKGLEYTPTDGEKQKFPKLGDLYTHLGKEHKLSESATDLKGIVKDYESEVQSLPNRPKLSKLKAFSSAKGAGLDADGDHDGEEDGASADAKREAPIKKLVAKVDAEKKVK